MFGRREPAVFVLPGRSDTHHHHTTIKQQPHDPADAARLYGELLEKARAEVIEAMAQEIPSIDAKLVTLATMRDPMSLNDKIGVVFKVNGRTINTVVEVQSDDSKTMEAVYDALSEGITRDVLRLLQKDLIKAGVR